jgi:hypothetical protein
MNTRYAWPVVALAMLPACAEDEKRANHFRAYAAPVGAELAELVAQNLARACPPEGLAEPETRDRCADALADDAVLSASLREPYLRWGGQAADAGLDLERSNTTRLDPLVWRRLYLSTFAFPGDHRIEQDGAQSARVLQLPEPSAHRPARDRDATRDESHASRKRRERCRPCGRQLSARVACGRRGVRSAR